MYIYIYMQMCMSQNIYIYIVISNKYIYIYVCVCVHVTGSSQKANVSHGFYRLGANLQGNFSFAEALSAISISSWSTYWSFRSPKTCTRAKRACHCNRELLGRNMAKHLASIDLHIVFLAGVRQVSKMMSTKVMISSEAIKDIRSRAQSCTIHKPQRPPTESLFVTRCHRQNAKPWTFCLLVIPIITQRYCLST